MSRIRHLQPPYCYYAYAVSRDGLADYMHYGYWKEDTRSIVEAQENLADLMKSYIPAETRTILDSGCGLGRTTSDLSEKGFDVTGISPDQSLIDEARRRFPAIEKKFVCVKFEDYSPSRPFDLVFFQESSQYIDTKVLFEQLAKLVRHEGYVLICDEVRYSQKPRLFNRRSDMLAFAASNGFSMLRNEVITDQVLETRRFFTRLLRENVDDIKSLFGGTDRDVEKEVFELADAWDRETAFFDSHDYGYEVFLLKKSAPARHTAGSVLLGASYLLKRKSRTFWNRIRDAL